MPLWHHGHRHHIGAGGLSPPVPHAVADVTWREVPVFRALMGATSFGRNRPPRDTAVLAFLTARGLTCLCSADDEVVLGGVVRVLPPAGPVALGGSPGPAFQAFDEPGHYKVALSFRLAAGQLSTQTRVLATDPATARVFRRYWRVIRLPGGLIRLEWLYAIRRHGAGPKPRQ